MAFSFSDALRTVGDTAYDWSGAGNLMSGFRGMQDGVGLNDIGNIALGLGQAGLFFVPGGGGALAAGKIAAQAAKQAGVGALKRQGPRAIEIAKGLSPKKYGAGTVQNVKQAGAQGVLKRGATNTAIGTGLTAAAGAMLPSASAATSGGRIPSTEEILRSWQQTQQAAALMGTNTPPATAPDLSGVSTGGGGDSAYSAATAASNSQYKSELDAAKRALNTQLMGVGQLQAGSGADLSMAAAQMGLDTSPQLDVGLDSLAQRAALQQLAARGEFAQAKGEAEAQLRQRQSAAALERQQRQQQAALQQMQLLYGLA